MVKLHFTLLSSSSFNLNLKSNSNHRSNNICRISHDPFLFLLKSINIPIAGGYAEYAARCYAKLREPRGHVPRPVPVNCLGAWVCLSLPGYLSLPGSAWLPGYLSLPGYLLGQLGESVPDPAPVNLWTIQDYPSLIETIVLLKQCSSESCKSGRGAPPMLRPSQSSNGASVYTLDEGPYPNCVSSKGHQTWYPQTSLFAKVSKARFAKLSAGQTESSVGCLRCVKAYQA